MGNYKINHESIKEKKKNLDLRLTSSPNKSSEGSKPSCKIKTPFRYKYIYSEKEERYESDEERESVPGFFWKWKRSGHWWKTKRVVE